MTNEELAALPWYQRGLLSFLGWPFAWRAMANTDRALAQTATVIALAQQAVAECKVAQSIARDAIRQRDELLHAEGAAARASNTHITAIRP